MTIRNLSQFITIMIPRDLLAIIFAYGGVAKRPVISRHIRDCCQSYTYIISFKKSDIIRLFITACRNNQPETLKLCLRHPKFDPGYNNNHAIGLAVLFNHLTIVQILLADPRVNPAANDNYALKAAFLGNPYRDRNIIKVLLAHPQINPGCENNQAIHWVAEYGYVDIMEMLLNDERINRNIDKYVSKIFLTACYHNHINIIELFLTPRYFNNAINFREALARASQRGSLEIVKILMDNHAVMKNISGVGIRDSVDQSLHQGYPEITLFILEKIIKNPTLNINMEVKSPHNFNYYLFVASARGYREVVIKLLADNFFHTDLWYFDCIKFARYHKHREIVQILYDDKRIYQALPLMDRLDFWLYLRGYIPA